MFRILIPFLLLFLLSCNDDQQNPDPENPTEQTQPAVKEPVKDGLVNSLNDEGVITESGIDKASFDPGRVAGYTRLLSGTWEQLASPDSRVKIDNESISFLSGGKIDKKENFELIVRCKEESVCLSKGEYLGGCCLITDNGCYIVKRIDHKNLHLQIAGQKDLMKFLKLED